MQPAVRSLRLSARPSPRFSSRCHPICPRYTARIAGRAGHAFGDNIADLDRVRIAGGTEHAARKDAGRRSEFARTACESERPDEGPFVPEQDP